MKLESAEPRIFGLVPPTVALALGVGALIVGIVLLVAGGLLAALVWLIAGVVLLAFAMDASRRWPASRLPRLAVTLADGAGRHFGLARVTAGAWGDASRRMVALRSELRGLRKEREDRLSELGAAAYRGDEAEARHLRERIAAIDRRIEGCEQAIDEAAPEARERIQQERIAVQPTEAFAVAEEPPPPADDERTRTTPTTRRPASPAGP